MELSFGVLSLEVRVQGLARYLGGEAQWKERVEVLRLLGNSRNLSGTWR